MDNSLNSNIDDAAIYSGYHPPGSADRRQGTRYRSVCRIARVHRADDLGLWRIRNISDQGMMLATNLPLEVGERIEIALSETIAVAGRIVWADKGRCGVQFDRSVNAAAMLAALAEEQRTERYRALRLPVEAAALVLLHDDARAIDLVNISQSGAGFIYESRLEPGTELDLLLPGDDQRRPALVRWSKGKRGGLWFRQPLDRSELESVARFRPRP